ncbi:MAG: cohesin domain-containing protein [Pseudomonadota bacterium]
MMRFATWLVAMLVATCLHVAQAATLSLSPPTQNVGAGQTIVVEVFMDFQNDPTVGGGFDVLYDESILDFDGFEFDAALGDDAAFRNTPTDEPGDVHATTFGDFAGLSGPSRIGQITFLTLAEGRSDLTIRINDMFGGFFSAATNNEQVVALENASVDVQAVPIPGAALLMLSALGVFAFRRRRSIATS